MLSYGVLRVSRIDLTTVYSALRLYVLSSNHYYCIPHGETLRVPGFLPELSVQ